MKKKIIFSSLIASLLFAACSNSTPKVENETNSTSKEQNSKVQEFIASSCHTCFELDKTQQESPKKKMSENDIFVINDSVAIFSTDGKEELGSVIRGFGGKKIKDLGDKTVVKFQAFAKDGDTKTLYTNSSFVIPAITLSKGEIKTNELEVAILNKDLNTNESQAWKAGEFAYYDNCSMCHAAHAPKEHTIREWEALYSSMKAFAMPNEHDDKNIWQYLKAHAKDGYALDDVE